MLQIMTVVPGRKKVVRICWIGANEIKAAASLTAGTAAIEKSAITGSPTTSTTITTGTA
jgi:hypothetical protein